MVAIHNTVGTLVVLAFLALAVANGLRAGGRSLPWARYVSYGAATLLLFQYLLGFSLLGSEGRSITWTHYTIALLALVPVGVEHGFANTRASERARGRAGLAATVVSFILVLIAYAIGMGN